MTPCGQSYRVNVNIYDCLYLITGKKELLKIRNCDNKFTISYIVK
jgi:hypothetical protein